MAQNINPLYSHHTTPSKNTEERQSRPQDNHAVTKRYKSKIDLGFPSNCDLNSMNIRLLFNASCSNSISL